MLNIQINNPDLERSLKQVYGNNTESMAQAFLQFLQQQEIQRDISISIRQLDAGEGIPLGNVIQDIRSKYE